MASKCCKRFGSDYICARCDDCTLLFFLRRLLLRERTIDHFLALAFLRWRRAGNVGGLGGGISHARFRRSLDGALSIFRGRSNARGTSSMDVRRRSPSDEHRRKIGPIAISRASVQNRTVGSGIYGDAGSKRAGSPRCAHGRCRDADCRVTPFAGPNLPPAVERCR